jgi:hypothetical protein
LERFASHPLAEELAGGWHARMEPLRVFGSWPGLEGLPNLVSTFSPWRTAAEMRDYATRQGGSHRTAMARDRERPFHHHSAFIRFRPYETRGECGRFRPLTPLPQPA